jgi:hypothetical protein
MWRDVVGSVSYCLLFGLLRGVGARGCGLGRVRHRVCAERRVPACPLEGLQSHTISELCNANNWRVALVHKFPKTCK